MGQHNKSQPRSGPQCTEMNTLGYRCGHNAVEGLDKCQFHSTERERQHAREMKEESIAARAAARAVSAVVENKPQIPTQTALEFLESTDNSQDFAKAVLTSLDFCEYIAEGLRTRTIPPTILLRLMDYAEGWGKPADRVEHTGKDGSPIITEVRRVIVRSREDYEQAVEQLQQESQPKYSTH